MIYEPLATGERLLIAKAHRRMAELPLSYPGRASAAPRLRLPWGAWGLRIAALSYFALFILIPLLVVSIQGLRGGLDTLWASVTRPVAFSAIWLTVWTALVMALINTI